MTNPAQDTDQRSDDELVEAVNAGDAAAFETLYRRHRDWVVSLAVPGVKARKSGMAASTAAPISDDRLERLLGL